MNIADIIIIAAIAAVLVIGFSVKTIRKKKGKSCCDCGSCDGCGK